MVAPVLAFVFSVSLLLLIYLQIFVNAVLVSRSSL